MKQWHQQKLRESLTGSVDLPQNATFQQEIHRWSMFRQDLKDKPSYLFVAFILVDSDYYPNIREIFHILLLTMPMGSVPCERSFSALRYLKQWNRTAIVEDRLNGPQGLDTIPPPPPSTLKTTKKIVTSPCERTSIIAHSQRRKCWQGQNTRQIRYGY